MTLTTTKNKKNVAWKSTLFENLIFLSKQRDFPPQKEDAARRNVHNFEEQLDLCALEEDLRLEKERRLRLGDIDILQVKHFQLLIVLLIVLQDLRQLIECTKQYSQQRKD